MLPSGSSAGEVGLGGGNDINRHFPGKNNSRASVGEKSHIRSVILNHRTAGGGVADSLEYLVTRLSKGHESAPPC